MPMKPSVKHAYFYTYTPFLKVMLKLGLCRNVNCRFSINEWAKFYDRLSDEKAT